VTDDAKVEVGAIADVELIIVRLTNEAVVSTTVFNLLKIDLCLLSEIGLSGFVHHSISKYSQKFLSTSNYSYLGVATLLIVIMC
jgi:hypothetical protein